MTDHFLNTTVRKGKFDAGHRVMHEKYKCFNVHGHEYHYELHFGFKTSHEIGYAIDFKEIKRVACQWIDDRLDHGFIANPKDTVLVEACRAVGSKLYLMNLVDDHGFCNPSAENIAKELFFAASILLNSDNLVLKKIRLFETVNCFVDCDGITDEEDTQLSASPLMKDLMEYRAEKGVVEYDERKTRTDK